MKIFFLPLLLLLSTVLSTLSANSHIPISNSPILISQLTSPQLNRAKNLARQMAEKINGGINNYRAEPSMHGIGEESPYQYNSDGSVTFTFMGKRPGEQNNSIESVIVVNLSTDEVVVEYNGPIR